MSKKITRLLTYQEASDILLPESLSKLYLGEVDGIFYWIKKNALSYIGLSLSGGKPFHIRGFVKRVFVGTTIEYENTSYLVSQNQASHIVLEKQSVKIKKAVL